MRSVIVTADKDFGQLIGDHDEQWDFSKDQRWDAHGVKQRLGVRPDQVADFLGLTGDAVDNIPGVPGVGARTAAQLLAIFDSLDALYARIEEVPYLRLRGAGQTYVRLKEHRAQAMLSRTLASIVLDAPVPTHPSGLARAAADANALDTLLDALRFGPLTKKRCQALRV